MNLHIHSKAKKELIKFKKKNKDIFNALLSAIDELEDKKLKASQIKSLEGLKNGYRKRVGRQRILFTVDYNDDVLKIWIIAIEKDTQKDYKKWISFINQYLQ